MARAAAKLPAQTRPGDEPRTQELLLEVMRYTRALAQEGVTLFGVGELGIDHTMFDMRDSR